MSGKQTAELIAVLKDRPQLNRMLDQLREGDVVTVPKGRLFMVPDRPEHSALIGTKVRLAVDPGPDNFRGIQAGSVALLVSGPSSKSHDPDNDL